MSDSGWQDISSAPKTGEVIELTWFEDGYPQEIYQMFWNPQQRNQLFPGIVGMWVTWDGSATWNPNNPAGAPTHWRRIISS